MILERSDSSTWPALARDAIERVVRGGDPTLAEFPLPTREAGAQEPHGGVFVTLYKLARLRGCIGTLDDSLALPDAVRNAAISAALHDPRFTPLNVGELRDIRINISILSKPRPWRSIDELMLGVHGILVRRDERRGLFLPQVAIEHRMSKEEFLSRCCTDKAGLPADAWRDPATEVLLFTTRVEAERG